MLNRRFKKAVKRGLEDLHKLIIPCLLIGVVGLGCAAYALAFHRSLMALVCLVGSFGYLAIAFYAYNKSHVVLGRRR